MRTVIIKMMMTTTIVLAMRMTVMVYPILPSWP
jgi:hypothetical protein